MLNTKFFFSVVVFFFSCHIQAKNFEIHEIDANTNECDVCLVMRVSSLDLSDSQVGRFYTSLSLDQFPTIDVANTIGERNPVYTFTNSVTGQIQERDSLSAGLTFVLVKEMPYLLFSRTVGKFSLPGEQYSPIRSTCFFDLATYRTTEGARWQLTEGTELFTGYGCIGSDQIKQGFVTSFVMVKEDELKVFLEGVQQINGAAKVDFDNGNEAIKKQKQRRLLPYQKAEGCELISLEDLIGVFSVPAKPQKLSLSTLNLQTGSATEKEIEFVDQFYSHFDTEKFDPNSTLLKTLQAALEIIELMKSDESSKVET